MGSSFINVIVLSTNDKLITSLNRSIVIMGLCFRNVLFFLSNKDKLITFLNRSIVVMVYHSELLFCCPPTTELESVSVWNKVDLMFDNHLVNRVHQYIHYTSLLASSICCPEGLNMQGKLKVITGSRKSLCSVCIFFFLCPHSMISGFSFLFSAYNLSSFADPAL